MIGNVECYPSRRYDLQSSISVARDNIMTDIVINRIIEVNTVDVFQRQNICAFSKFQVSLIRVFLFPSYKETPVY